MEGKLFTVMINKTKTSVVIFGVLTAMVLITAMNSQSAAAIGPKQEDKVWTVAPGHLKKSDEGSQSASAFAPGILQGKLPPGGCDAPNFAPGHLFRQEPTTTDINP